MKYRHIVVGGTFDRLHAGHKMLLRKAFDAGVRVTIGLTSDLFVQKYKQAQPVDEEESISGVCCPAISRVYIGSFQERKKILEDWCKKEQVWSHVSIVSIDDPFGPTLDPSNSYDAIVVSSETKKIALLVNKQRKKQRLPPLQIITVPFMNADDAIRISSTRIRNGEIDEKGKLLLPHILRPTLTEPIGTVIPDKMPITKRKQDKVISIGDTTTDALLTYGTIPYFACIDFSAKRTPFYWDLMKWKQLKEAHTTVYCASGPGYISGRVMKKMEDWGKHPTKSLFIISGEEDLLVLPAVLYAPIGSYVYYGQPDKGIVEVKVTKEKKHVVQTLLSRFTRT